MEWTLCTGLKHRDRYQLLEITMGNASASVAAVSAFMRHKLFAATDGHIDHFTDRLVEMADDQELDQMAYDVLLPPGFCMQNGEYRNIKWDKESWPH